MAMRRGYVFFLGVVIMSLVLAACDQQPAPGPIETLMPGSTVSPIGPVLPTETPAATPITPVASQVIDGIRISVQPVAFDAHRLIVAYSLEGPGQDYHYGLSVNRYEDTQAPAPKLSLSGKELPWIENMYSIRETSVAFIGPYPPPPGNPIRFQGTISFDSSKLEEDVIARNLPLQLSLPVHINTNLYIPPVPVPTGIAFPPTETPTPAHPESRIVVADLSFTAQFDPKHTVVQVGQTVERNQVQMTFEKLDITASETRLYIKYPVSSGDANTLLWDELGGSLQTGSGDGNDVLLFGEPIGSDEGVCGWDAGKGECIFSYEGPSLLSNTPRSYTLTVWPEESGSHTFLGGATPTEPSAWVFHFKVPAFVISR